MSYMIRLNRTVINFGNVEYVRPHKDEDGQDGIKVRFVSGETLYFYDTQAAQIEAAFTNDIPNVLADEDVASSDESTT